MKLFLFGLVITGMVNLGKCCPELTGKDLNIQTRRVARAGNQHRIPLCCRKRKAKQRSMGRTNVHKLKPKNSKTPLSPTLTTVPSKHIDLKMLKKVSKKFKASSLFDSNNPCMIWMACPVHHDPQFKAWFNGLPSCPCHISPAALYNNNTVYDLQQKKRFNWKVIHAKSGKLNIFKPDAAYCIQQQLSMSASSPSAQQCCYDKNFQLITRGSGAGTPHLVAPEIDYSLHSEVDLKPFILCQGDWTRYQAVRSPNNGYNCTDNPNQGEFIEQVKRARDY